MKEIKRILTVCWMTPFCRSTIPNGVFLADKFGAELYVLHIVNTLWFHGWNLPMITVMEERKKDLDRLKQELDNIVDHEKKKGMTIREFVREGEPAEIIEKMVKEENIDLLVLRAHRESPADRFLVGGSNDAIIRKMPCAIFLARD